MVRNNDFDYIGVRVIVRSSNKITYRKSGLIGKVGTVVKNGSSLGVKLDDIENESSSVGVYWFSYGELDEFEENGGLKMEGNFRIAIVELENSYSYKDYGFALFDEQAQIGDMVIVNPMNKFTLAKIKNIQNKEEYGKSVSKEVIQIVDMTAFNTRVLERENAAKLEKEKKEIQKELDKKIANLKDLEFYERMAKKLGERDPEIAEMVSKLKGLKK